MRQYVFKEHEGSFLVGALAAMASKSGQVGFIGGMDIPLIRKFACGYVQGAKAVNAKVEVFQNMTGTTPAAWNDPAKGSELAKSQFDRGADVVYAAAGGTGAGVYQAAADSGKLAIGVDSNQNYMHPGTMLTSMLKRVDLATYETFMDVKSGNFTSGVKAMGLAEDGVGWAYDKYNKPMITDVMKSTINGLSDKVKSGAIKVHDYMNDNKCPS
jgi:basic membrane protein A